MVLVHVCTLLTYMCPTCTCGMYISARYKVLTARLISRGFLWNMFRKCGVNVRRHVLEGICTPLVGMWLPEVWWSYRVWSVHTHVTTTLVLKHSPEPRSRCGLLAYASACCCYIQLLVVFVSKKRWKKQCEFPGGGVCMWHVLQKLGFSYKKGDGKNEKTHLWKRHGAFSWLSQLMQLLVWLSND